MSTIIFLLCSHVEEVWWASPRETNETYWDQFQFLMGFQPENLITYINVDANNKYHVLSISKQKTRKGFQSNKVHFSWLWHTWCWSSAKSPMLTWPPNTNFMLISLTQHDYGPTVIGYFRVPKNHTFKTRLSSKPLLWKWVLFAS